MEINDSKDHLLDGLDLLDLLYKLHFRPTSLNPVRFTF